MTHAEFLDEVRGVIEREAKHAIAKEWIVEATLAGHPEIEGLSPFPALCVREYTEDVVELLVRQIKRQRAQLADARQLDFQQPGFERIQDHYTIIRDGKSMVVPTEEMTPSELREKAKEHRQMGAGHDEHAEELDRLADVREADAR